MLAYIIMGLHTLLSIGAAINLLYGERSCSELNRKFPLTLDPPNKDLPGGTTLNKYSPFTLPSVSTNITSTTSLLQYISFDDASNLLWKSISSDNIVVKDHFL